MDNLVQACYLKICCEHFKTDDCAEQFNLYFNLYTVSRLDFPGLIIDAFGELRDQQEQVKEDMEVKSQPSGYDLWPYESIWVPITSDDLTLIGII